MDYCFDTSAICARHVASLYDDPKRPAIVTGLLASGRILITAVNVLEAAGTEDTVRRLGVLRLQKELARGLRPLHVPNELLLEVTLAHTRSSATATITLSEAQAGIYEILQEPEQIGEQERQEVYDWKRSSEDSFAQAHQKARPEFQKIFGDVPQDRPLTADKICPRQNVYPDRAV